MNNSDDIWYIYVLRCIDNSLYTGISKDPVKRYKSHISGKGAKYTRSRLPVSIIAVSAVGSHSVALTLEYKFKKLSKSQKEEFLTHENGLMKFIELNQKNELIK